MYSGRIPERVAALCRSSEVSLLGHQEGISTPFSTVPHLLEGTATSVVQPTICAMLGRPDEWIQEVPLPVVGL